MKKQLILTLLCLLMGTADLPAQGGTGVYAGGHIRRARPNTIKTLRNSGFTYVILFNVHVDADGTLMVDNGGEAGGIICRNGEYIFNKVQPYYAADIRDLKTAPTSIERIEICIGGWGNDSYNHIRELINKEGTGEETILYRNFKALKEAIPEIEAVNNDDEQCYDASTAVKFHAMMFDLGYKTTVAPYTNKSFWNSLVTQLNRQRSGACDRVLIQCYDGGAYNNPSDWKLGDLPVHAGRTNYQTDMETSLSQMKSWKSNNGVVGAFVWVYNDETWNLHNWATAMNRIYPSKTVTSRQTAVTVYSEVDYGGYSVALPEGSYHLADLAAYGVTQKDIESIKVREGYQIQLFINDELRGTASSSVTFTASSPDLSYVYNGRDRNYRNRAVSLIISKVDESGVSPVKTDDMEPSVIYNLQGQRIGEPTSGQVYIYKGKKIAPRGPISEWSLGGAQK
ncbi:MAG: hypothetical protein IJ539_02430 [Prevotella sp.]|nr:hypothetical protein [Prevotella sp.]